MDHEDRETVARELQRKITDWFQRTRDEIMPAVAKMYQGRYWAELGYDSWDRYLADGIGPLLDTLRTKAAFPGVVEALTTAGLSTRAIADVTGTDQSTVSRRQRKAAGDANASPAQPAVTMGRDGKTYPKASRQAKPRGGAPAHDGAETDDEVDKVFDALQSSWPVPLDRGNCRRAPGCPATGSATCSTRWATPS